MKGFDAGDADDGGVNDDGNDDGDDNCDYNDDDGDDDADHHDMKMMALSVFCGDADHAHSSLE